MNRCDTQLAQPVLAARPAPRRLRAAARARGTARSPRPAPESPARSSPRSSRSAAATRRSRRCAAPGSTRPPTTRRSAPSRSALLTTKMSAISMMPALSACTSSPVPGTSVTIDTSAVRMMSTSSWPTPTVSMMTTSLPAASSTSAASPVARARPPRWPRVAMLRMNTPASDAVRLHPQPIAEHGAAGERAGRIDGDHADACDPRARGCSRRSADRPACSCRRPAGR